MEGQIEVDSILLACLVLGKILSQNNFNSMLRNWKHILIGYKNMKFKNSIEFYRDMVGDMDILNSLTLAWCTLYVVSCLEVFIHFSQQQVASKPASFSILKLSNMISYSSFISFVISHISKSPHICRKTQSPWCLCKQGSGKMNTGFNMYHHGTSWCDMTHMEVC